MGSIKERNKINIYNNHNNNQNNGIQETHKDNQAVGATEPLAPAMLTEYIEYPEYSEDSDYSNSGLSLEAIAKDQINLETDIETFTALQDKLVKVLEDENIKETGLALQAMNLVMQNIIANYQARPLQELWQAIFIFFENIKKEVAISQYSQYESSARGGK